MSGYIYHYSAEAPSGYGKTRKFDGLATCNKKIVSIDDIVCLKKEIDSILANNMVIISLSFLHKED